MDPEALDLADRAGTLLVQQVPSGNWERVCAAVVWLWRRYRREDAPMVESGLAGMRDELLTSGAAADLAARRTAVTAWQMQFRALLAAGPAPAAELRMLVADGLLLSAADREPSYTCDVTMKAVAEDHGTVHQLGQGIMHVTVGTRARIEGR